jgi:hypothetical protein
MWSWDSSVGIATGYGLAGVLFSAEAIDLFLLHSVQTGSGVYRAVYTVGKAAGA